MLNFLQAQHNLHTHAKLMLSYAKLTKLCKSYSILICSSTTQLYEDLVVSPHDRRLVCRFFANCMLFIECLNIFLIS